MARRITMKKDLRFFLKVVEDRSPELLLRINKEVNPQWEISSIQKKLEVEGRFPILVFEKVKGCDMRLVTNLFATRRHLALALETFPEEIPLRLTEAKKNRIKPKIVKSGPVKNVVLKDDKADLRKLPIVTHCEKDVGPYITGGMMIIRDPVSGHLNGGTYRHRYLSPKKLTVNLAPLCHASEITLQAEAGKMDVEAAIVIGHHPTMGMASQERGEISDFELEMMGGLLNGPVDVVPCETVNVLVPADAEIVIEGKIKTDSWEYDGPFGDYWLYYAPPKKARVFEVTAITHRFDAIFHDIFNVGPEHLVLFSLGMEALVFSQLKQLIPQVKAVHVPVSGSANLVYIQIRKDMEGLGVNTALAALGTYRFKCAIVVDEDIDIYDDKKVIWAVMTRTQADRSFFSVPGSYISRVDPTGYSPWNSVQREDRLLSTRLGIDATKPLDSLFPEVADPPKDMWTKVNLSEYLK
jgi:UbiD family decarboxylase